MILRRDRCFESSLRRLAAGAALACLLLGTTALPVQAQLVPAGFFEQVPAIGGPAKIEADTMAYNAATDVISAEGGVVMHYEGYVLTADRLEYDQKTSELVAIGNAVVHDPDGTVYRGDRLRITDSMKRAFMESLTMTTPGGGIITADDADYTRELITVLEAAHYTPCGDCIDAKGRRIGWKINATKMTWDREGGVIYMDNPSLEVLGVPVAWLPWIMLPDPSQPRRQGFRMPSWDFDEKYGARLDVPYFIPVGDDADLLLIPTLLSRQGFLMAAEFQQRFDYGTVDVAASGIYQLDPAAYAGTIGNTEFRGAMVTTGAFRPFKNWRAGWSYTAFTDAAYLHDYKLNTADNVINELYATYLTRDSYLDLRLQQFNRLDDFLDEAAEQLAQERQGRAIPSIEAAQYHDLGEWGQVALTSRLLGVQREADHYGSYGPPAPDPDRVPYVFGYEGTKVHAMLEGSWQNRYILPAGLVATPYLGLRADASWYERTAAPLPADYETPASEVSLLEATPIAAMDLRWPLIAVDGYDSHIFEPVAQLVYRGSETTLVGIINDDAQSFVFDDTNLFSYNRFSGSDRQETGLRANIGARYVANFADGSWLQLIGGQSYHLAGPNALGIVDAANTGASSGLGEAASYIVLGAQGGLNDLKFGAKTQLDPDGFAIRRASAAAQMQLGPRQSVGAEYTYIPADIVVGTLADQHEVTVRGTTPLPFDYWYADASVSWDLAGNSWLRASGGLTYDDEYFSATLYGSINGPTHSSPDAYSFGMKFRLSGPDGEFSF